MRVTAGMRDLRSLYVRANTCVACHQNIENELLKAGHPAMLFELDSQSVNQPRHWKDEDPWIGPRAWLTGQAVALREASWHSRVDVDPAADAQQTSLALAWLLAKVTSLDPALPQVAEPTSSDLEPLQKQADDLARSAAASWKPSAASTMSLLRALAATDLGSTSREALFYRARRLVLVLDRLSAALDPNSATPHKLDQELNALREEVRVYENFNPARFAQHLGTFHAKLQPKPSATTARP